MIKLPDTDGLQDRVRLSEQTGPGPRLRAAREASGYEIEDIAKQLRLHPHIIADLERDTFDDHLALVFVRGYLRSYAGLIGLDPEQVVKEFNALGHQEDRDLPDIKSKSQGRSRVRPDQSMSKSSGRPLVKWAAIVAVALAIGGVFVAYNYGPEEQLYPVPVKMEPPISDNTQGLDIAPSTEEPESTPGAPAPTMTGPSNPSGPAVPPPGQALPNSGRPVVKNPSAGTPPAPGAAASSPTDPSAPAAAAPGAAGAQSEPELPKPKRAPVDDDDSD